MVKHSIASIIVLWCLNLSCQTTQELFLQANKLYERKEYHQACKVYESIQHKGPAIYFNCGNAYFHQKMYDKALLYWKKASLFKPFYRDAQANIQTLYKDLARNDKRPLIHATNGFTHLLDSASTLMLQILFLVLLYLLCFLLPWLYSARHRMTLSILILVVGVSGGVLVAQLHHASYRNGIILSDSKVYAGPGENYHHVGEVHTIDEVMCGASMVTQSGQWHKISAHNVSGWINDATIALL